MLIGVNGFKGSGKDTVADWLVRERGFVKLSLADPLKDAFCILFQTDRETLDELKNDPNAYTSLQRYEDLDRDGSNENVKLFTYRTVRETLQVLGSEVGRDLFGEDFWIKQLVRNIGKFSTGTDIVVPDCRFENELKQILNMGGKTIRVRRPGYDSDGHVSEVRPHPGLITWGLDNNGTVQDLYDRLEDLFDVPN
jgi:hypothetical protein